MGIIVLMIAILPELAVNGAQRLALVHVSSRYAGNPTPIESEAREAFDGERAFVPDDGDAVDVPFPE